MKARTKPEEFEGYPVYQQMMDILLGSGSPEDLKNCVHPEFTGFGSAAHEVFRDRGDLLAMARKQLEQYGNQQIDFRRSGLSGRFLDHGDTYLISEEFQFLIRDDEHAFPLRVTTLLQKEGKKWLVTHMHGSTPDTNIAEGEAFPDEGLRKKNRELEEKIRERTRELEIEAALERVRTRAMAMQKTEDISDVAVVFLDQLKELGLSFIQAWINVIHPEEGYIDIWFSPLEGVYEDPAHWQLPMALFEDTSMKSWTAGNTFSYISLTSKEEVDELVEACDEATGSTYFSHFQNILKLECLEFVDANYKYGTVSKSDHVKATEEEEAILHRFAKVFEQTYTRFLDLQKAETQAREAEIELALERVRNRAMSMRSSGELAELVITVFQELSGLDMVLTRCLLWIFNPEDNSSTAWMTNSEDPGKADRYLVPYHDHPAYLSYLKGWKARDPKWEYELKGKEKDKWDEILVYGYFARLPEAIKEAMKEPECVTLSGSFNKFGVIQTASLQPLSRENRDILFRFSQVFEQAYTRFKDLVTAEAQAREARIELALERIRAQVTAMQESSDLLDIVVTMRSEFVKLGHNAHYFWHMRWLPETYQKAMTSGDGTRIGMVMELPRHIHGDISLLSKWEKGKEPTVVYTMDTEAALDYVHKMVALGDFQQIDPHAPGDDDIRQIGGLTFVMARTTHGEIGFSLPGEVPEPSVESLETLMRFAGVFDLAYRRFEDLKEAEKQARESSIEAALEKVRSRTMAMQHSDELPEAANVLFLEVQALGIPAWSCGYNILAADKKSASCIMSSEGAIQKPFRLRLKGESSFDQWGEFVRGDTDFMVQELGGKALEAHYGFMKSFPDLRPIFEEIDQAGLSLPTYQINHLCKFNHGFLLFITYEEVPGAHDIFKRFTTVFEQTYTRFLDLKRAEAQARESKIETALERIRARALAMQEPEELREVVQVLRREMGLLGVEELETSSIYITDAQVQKAECWFAIKDLREEKKVMVTDHFALDLAATWVGREMLKFYGSDAEKVSIEMKGDQRKEWIDYCETQSQPLRGYYGEEIPDRTYHLYKFSDGAIGAATPGALSEESWSLLKRTSAAFSLAYSRFKDLTQARLDLQLLKEEKKRAEDALKELQLTQQQLVHAEKMASLGELTAGIAHEIQNPLNFVNNFSDVSRELLEELLEEIKNGDMEEVDALTRDVMQNLEKIVHHGRRADSIVKGMLQHSRSGDGKKEPTNLNALADEYLRLAYHGLRARDKSFNASMETDFDDSVGEVDVVPQDIGRVLLNLITNAFHAVSDRNGAAPEGFEPTVWVKTRRTGDGVEISIRDNGGGIPEEIKDKIFQPFFTTRPTGEGTGLGLSMAYDIVTKGHGGRLGVQSTEGEGSEFIITLNT